MYIVDTCRWPEGVVQRVVDRPGRNAQDRSHDAVDGQAGLQAAVLLVGVDVGQALDFAHLGPAALGPRFLDLRDYRPAGCIDTGHCWRGRPRADPARLAETACRRAPWPIACAGRPMTSSALSLRSSNGRSDTNMRQALAVPLLPPIEAVRLSTAGSSMDDPPRTGLPAFPWPHRKCSGRLARCRSSGRCLAAGKKPFGHNHIQIAGEGRSCPA